MIDISLDSKQLVRSLVKLGLVFLPGFLFLVCYKGKEIFDLDGLQTLVLSLAVSAGLYIAMYLGYIFGEMLVHLFEKRNQEFAAKDYEAAFVWLTPFMIVVLLIEAFTVLYPKSTLPIPEPRISLMWLALTGFLMGWQGGTLKLKKEKFKKINSLLFLIFVATIGIVLGMLMK